MKAKWLRIYIGESYKYGGKPAYKAILELLKKNGIPGATVLRGIESYGPKSGEHSVDILRFSMDLPVVIDTIAESEAISRVLPKIKEILREGLIISMDVEIEQYNRNGN